VWRLNPSVIFKDDQGKRMAVLAKFRAESDQADLFDEPAPASKRKHLRSVG